MDKVSYALGMSTAYNLVKSGVNTLVFPDYCEGFKDMLTDGGKTSISIEECNRILAEHFEKIRKEEADTSLKEGREYLEANRKEGVSVTASGLQYKVLKEGTGKKPGKHATVSCHYEGRLVNGDVFDSSYQRGVPTVFGLDQVIQGWREGLQMMSEGSKYELTIPASLAYGEKGVPGVIPPNSVLVFVVELVKVM